MDAVEVLEAVLTLDQVQELADLDEGGVGDSSTHQLLDDLLGRFEEDESPIVLAHCLAPEFHTESDE